MLALIQRVTHASVSVDRDPVGASGPGLLDARSVEAFRKIAQASQPVAKRPVEERQLDVLEDIRDELAGDVTEIDRSGF